MSPRDTTTLPAASAHSGATPAEPEPLDRRDAPATLDIRPVPGWRAIDFRELWRYRELLYFLVWRDVKVRYKQTVLGAGWAVLQPVMMMVVFSVFFGRFGGMDRNVKVAYPIFVFSALLPWQFLSASVSQAGQSLLTSQHLISKVYFPRLLVPLSSVGHAAVDFGISCVVLFLLMAGYGVPFHASLLLLPLFLLGTAATAVGAGALLSALVIAYRDFRYLLTFMVQLWMFASPVAYPLEVVPPHLRTLYSLNPMTGWITGFRCAVLGDPIPWGTIGISGLVTAGLLAAGTLYFRRTERRFADII